MQVLKKRGLQFHKTSFCRALAVLCLVFSLAGPPKAFAQICETPGMPEAGQMAMDAAQRAAVTGMTTALKTAYATEKGLTELWLQAVLDAMDTAIMDILDWFWNNWSQALKDMTAQLHGGIIDQSRQLAGNFDADEVSATRLMSQNIEIQAHAAYQPTAQGCQFDTTARYMSRSRQASTAVATGYAQDFNGVGNNNRNSPSATGRASLQQTRWQMYQSKFCDRDNNNGAAGCSSTSVTANMNALPSKTIFAKETIDMTDADTREAVNQLLFNITGYEPSDPIMPSALNSSAGLQQQQENREYITQMDAIGALAYAVVAARTPGQAAPEIKAMRQRAGVMDASDTPSEREIRQSVIEQVSDPGYYKELYDSPSTIPQKELYLKAYSLLMLYDMIGKQEKISNVYAIETANMLNEIDDSRHSASSSAPLR